jgi:ankyrin repeat protein
MDSGYQELSNQFLQAAKLGKSRAISALIKFDRTLIDSIDQNNSNALMLAAGNGHVNTVELLIRLGVKKDTVNNDLDTALIIASRAGYAEIVQIFIRYCPDRAIQNKAGYTALMYAAEKGHVQVVKRLIPRASQGESLNLDNHREQKADAALILAVKHCQIGVVNALTAHRVEVEVNCVDSDGNTPLMHAVSQNDLKMVDLLVRSGATDSLKVVNKKGKTALILAIQQGNQKIASRLMITMSDAAVKNLQLDPFYQPFVEAFHQGIITYREKILKKQADLSLSLADLKLKDESMGKENIASTPSASRTVFSLFNRSEKAGHNLHQKALTKKLLQAAKFGDKSVILELIDCGVNLDAKDENGFTALMAAVSYNCFNTAQLLIAKGVNVNAQNKEGNTALIIASHGAFGQMVSFLLTNGADVTVKNKYGVTALIEAARNGQTNIVKLLLPLEGQIKTQSANSQCAGMALIFAVQHGHESVVDYLLTKQMQVNINERGIENTTPLMVAAYNGFSSMIEKLMTAGADISAVNSRGDSALQLAMMMGHEKIVFQLKTSAAQKAVFPKESITQSAAPKLAVSSSNEATLISSPVIFRDITNRTSDRTEMTNDIKKGKSRLYRPPFKISSSTQKNYKTRVKPKNMNVNSISSWRKPA